MIGEVVVGQDQIRFDRTRGRESQRSLAILGHRDVIAFFGQECFEQLPDIGIILDDQKFPGAVLGGLARHGGGRWRHVYHWL